LNDIQSVYVSKKEIAKEMSIIISERNMSKKYKKGFLVIIANYIYQNKNLGGLDGYISR
jgi:hypothetical protein